MIKYSEAISCDKFEIKCNVSRICSFFIKAGEPERTQKVLGTLVFN
jgi:hypothetical protein